MPLSLAIGCAATALAPLAIVIHNVAAARPLLIVISVAAAFIHMLALTLVALIHRQSGATHASPFLLWHAVAIQQISRYLTYRLYTYSSQWMEPAVTSDAHSKRSNYGRDKLNSAVATGAGVSLINILMLHGDNLRFAALPGSLYMPACSLSMFAIDAINCSIMGLLNVSLNIISWMNAYPRNSLFMVFVVTGLHISACFMTYWGSFAWCGCLLALSGLVCVVISSYIVAAMCVS